MITERDVRRGTSFPGKDSSGEFRQPHEAEDQAWILPGASRRSQHFDISPMTPVLDFQPQNCKRIYSNVVLSH